MGASAVSSPSPRRGGRVRSAMGAARPVSGAGISKALQSGLAAGECVVAALTNGGPGDFTHYEQAVNATWGREYRRGRLFHRLVGVPALTTAGHRTVVARDNDERLLEHAAVAEVDLAREARLATALASLRSKAHHLSTSLASGMTRREPLGLERTPSPEFLCRLIALDTLQQPTEILTAIA